MVVCLSSRRICFQLSLNQVDIMNKCETALKLKDIDLHSSTNHLVAKEIDIAFVALT